MPKKKYVAVPKKLLKDAIRYISEAEERFLDDAYECGQMGSHEGQVLSKWTARKIRIIREQLEALNA